MREMRVLLLTTPLGDGPPNGASLAALDLARALAAAGLARPILLVRGEARVPDGCEALRLHTGRARALEALAAVVRARADVVHAMFAPRVATGVALRALSRVTRSPVVQTIASRPRSYVHVGRALAGRAVVATSRATERALLDAGIAPGRVSTIPLPFAAPQAVELPPKAPPGRWILFGGDYEFGDALAPTLEAFAQLAPPRGMNLELVIAARAKTERSRTIERTLRARIERSPALQGRVRILGEVASLLPWILGAAAVVLPARDTFAKIDHPRVLLEAIALGVPIVVGPAPSIAELVREGDGGKGDADGEAAIGEVTNDVPALREAIERVLVQPAPSPAKLERIASILARRSPARIAEAYAALYARVT